MANILEVRGLAKTYKGAGDVPFHAVKHISFDVEEGQILSLLGPNGAGKTTTISMISGLVKPTEGDALVAGHSITSDGLKARAAMGFVPQEIALYPTLSARQNLDFFGRMYGLGGRALSSRIDEVLDFIDLKDRQKDRIQTFSGGMKRRVNIGVGLLHKPKLIYMDEPTVGVDPQSRRRILDTVMRMRDEIGMSVLYTTHQMEEAQEISDRVGIIDHGEIIAFGTVGELVRQVGEEDRLVFNLGEQKPPDGLEAKLQKEVKGLTRVTIETREPEGSPRPTYILTIYARRGRSALPDLIRLASASGVDVLSVEVREPDLEAVFLQLTGRALRD
jgi:ABC-2 type transport system ATP-binding protein